MTELGHSGVGQETAQKRQRRHERREWRKGIVAVVVLVVGCGSPVYFRTAGKSDGGVLGVEKTGSGGATAATGGTGPGPSGNPGLGGVSGGQGITDAGGMGSGATAGAGAGGITCAPGITRAVSGDSTSDVAQYPFEVSTQSWGTGVGSPAFATVDRSTAQHFAGQSSLAGSIAAVAPGVYILEVDPARPAIPQAATVTFHVYVPDGAAITWIQPYVQDTNFAFSGVYADVGCLTRGGWTALTLTVPSAAMPIGRLGVQFYVASAWTGTVYLDSINW